MYSSFEGNYRRVPQQTLSGASVVRSRQVLLDSAKRQREEREQNRKRESSSLKIQSWIRSWLSRLSIKRGQRLEFDKLLYDKPPHLDLKTLTLLTKKLLFFYSDQCDVQRLNFVSEQTLRNHQHILQHVIVNESSSWSWYIPWLLRLNIILIKEIIIRQSNETITVPLRLIEVFTSKETLNRIEGVSENWSNKFLANLFVYITRCDYFECLRLLLINRTPPLAKVSPKPPTQLCSAVLDMIEKSFFVQNTLSNEEFREIVGNMCLRLFAPSLAEPIKMFLIPALSSTENFPIEAIVESLYNDQIHVPRTSYLLYMLCNVDKNYFGSDRMLANVTLTIHYLQLLAILTKNLLKLGQRKVTNSDDDDDDDLDDEQNENLVVIDNNEIEILQQCVALLNEPKRVQEFILICDQFDNPIIFLSVCQICHNLLTSTKQPIYYNRLLYMLAQRPGFLYRIWSLIVNANQTSVFGLSTQLVTVLARGLPLADEESDQIVPLLTVFCALMSILLPTLDDSDFFLPKADPTDLKSSKRPMPFSQSELIEISKLLRDISLGLVDLAFTDTRPTDAIYGFETHHSPRNQTLLWSYLFKIVVSVIRQLHSRDSHRPFCPEGHWISNQVQINGQLPLFRPKFLRGFRSFHALRALYRDELEPHTVPLTAKEVRMAMLFKELPFLVDFEKRVVILQSMVIEDKMQVQGNSVNFLQGPDVRLSVRRNYLYEDAFDKLSLTNEPNLKLKMRVRLINRMGLDEAGVDGGGICREFLTELLKTAFDPHRGFFKLTQNNLLYPNPNIHLIMENFAEHYFFIGRILGKAIYENLLVELPMADFFLQKLIGRQSDVDIHHLESLDPVMYRNLIFLKNYEGDVQDLGLDFTILNEELGERRVDELKPDGVSIPVTSANRIEYIHLMADYKLNKQIRTQCAAFRMGLINVFPIEWIQMFNYRELQVLISGAEIPVDVNDLRAHTIYAGGYYESHPTIRSFWRVLHDFTDLQKRQLLKFVTSCSRPPLLGFKELDPAFCIQNAGANDRLPTASTCMNLLKLPEFQDDQVLSEKLLYAIQAGAGFELS